MFAVLIVGWLAVAAAYRKEKMLYKMSVSLWRWTENCEGRFCCGDCDECPYNEEDEDDM